MSENRVAIPGSAAERPTDAARTQPADPERMLEVTIVIRRPPGSQQHANELLAGTQLRSSRQEVERELAANAKDLQAAVDFAHRYGLEVIETSPEKRMVRVRGSVRQMNEAFGVELAQVAEPGTAPYLSYDGPVRVDGEVAPAIAAVLGLHQRPVHR